MEVTRFLKLSYVMDSAGQGNARLIESLIISSIQRIKQRSIAFYWENVLATAELHLIKGFINQIVERLSMIGGFDDR